MAGMVYPDPHEPLTPGQIIKLGGLFVYHVYKGIIDRYEVSKFVWIDPCKNEMKRTLEYRNFREYFIVEKDTGTGYLVYPRPNRVGEVVFVRAIPSKFTSLIVGGLFWFKVPSDLYKEVLKMDGEIDDKFVECRKKRRHARYYAKSYASSKIVIDISDESVQKIASAISESLTKVISNLINAILNIKAEQVPMQPTRQRQLSEGELEDIRKLNRIRSKLLVMDGVYQVDVIGREIVVMCSGDAVDKVKEFLTDNGINVVSVAKLEEISIVRGVLKT